MTNVKMGWFNALLVRIVLGMALVLAAGPARAQSEADKATARELAIDAQKALEAKDYATAADLFGRADKLYHAPTLLVGLARAYVGLGKYVEAREAYNRVIREKLPDNAPEAYSAAVEDAKNEISGLDDKIGWLTIAVKGTDDARVTLDDADVAAASLGVKRAVNPGEHRIRAEAPGFMPAEATVRVAAGAAEEVVLTLEADPDAPAVPDAPDKDATSAGPSTLSIVGYVAIGLGGAGLVLGAVTGGLAMGKHGELEDNCPGGVCQPHQQDNLDSFHTLGTLSTVGFVVGGVLAATGIVLVVVDNVGGSGEGEASLELQLSPVSAGATLRF